MSPVRNDQYEEEETEGGDYEGDEAEHGLRENEVGDVEANCIEEDMDHDLPYLRSHASDSEDEGPDEDVDEDGERGGCGGAMLQRVSVSGTKDEGVREGLVALF
jgi:hypothetical protein